MAPPDGQNRLELAQIAAYLRDLADTQAHTGTSSASLALDPPTNAQLAGLLQYLEDYRPPTDTPDVPKRRPVLLHIGSGNGRAAVAAARLDVCSQSIGLDDDEQNIKRSIKLAFEQGVFERCHFFHIDNLAADPRILLDNPHLIAGKLNEADVVFVHAPPGRTKKWIPLLARLSSKKANRKFMTLAHHIPEDCAINPQPVEGTELCACDGIADDGEATVPAAPPPPEPVDNEDIDREFARSSVRHVLPERLHGGLR